MPRTLPVLLLLTSLVPAAAAASTDAGPAYTGGAMRYAGLTGLGLAAAEGGDAKASGESEFYNWAGPPAASPDWDGVKRDALYFLAFQFGGVGALYMMPESISGWTTEDKEEYSAERWWDNVSNPVWDEDEWYVNYVLHPYWGAAYYVRARERGLGEGQSLLFSTLNSALYEYGAEALFEPVSYTDLIVTPLFGWLLGEYVFVPWRERVRANPAGIGATEKALLTLTDPLGVLYGATDHALGLQTDFAFGPMRYNGVPAAPYGAPAHDPWEASPLASGSREAVWGMQWQVAW